MCGDFFLKYSILWIFLFSTNEMGLHYKFEIWSYFKFLTDERPVTYAFGLQSYVGQKHY